MPESADLLPFVVRTKVLSLTWYALPSAKGANPDLGAPSGQALGQPAYPPSRRRAGAASIRLPALRVSREKVNLATSIPARII
jgi:hypothetical protein